MVVTFAARRQTAGRIGRESRAVARALTVVVLAAPLQRSTATSWVSHDGLHWEEALSAPVQEQVELYAVAPAGPGVVAVGAFGGPDDVIPIILLSPAR